jgi:hypothetical protein
MAHGACSAINKNQAALIRTEFFVDSSVALGPAWLDNASRFVKLIQKYKRRRAELLITYRVIVNDYPGDLFG